MPRITGLALSRMIPNMLTLLALCSGMTAIRFGINGKFELGVIAILVAAVLDHEAANRHRDGQCRGAVYFAPGN